MICPCCLGDALVASTGALNDMGESVIVFVGKTNSRIRGLGEAIARAEALIATYRSEHTSDVAAEGDHRVRSCREQVLAYEASIEHHRALLKGRDGDALAACISCRGTGEVDDLPFPKKCGCGRSHDRAAWSALSFRGEQDDGDGGFLELRSCNGCGSTLTIQASRVDSSLRRAS